MHNFCSIDYPVFCHKQSTATEKTEAKVNQLLDYLATNPAAVIQFHASDMILDIHSDASYLSEIIARRRVVGHYMLGSNPSKVKPIEMNGAVYVFCGALKFVVASSEEAELGALFPNVK